MNTPSILKGAEPFFYPGSRTGCLTVHGFTGTPGEVHWLGKYLAGQGYTVYGPRLAGHGTHIQDLARPSWREWYLNVLAGYQLLRAQCDRIFVLGLSMGGALVLTLAGHEAVDGVVAMSAIYEIRDPRVKYLRLIAPFIASLPKSNTPQVAAFHQRVRDTQAALGEEVAGHPTYDHYPLRGVLEVQKLLRFKNQALPRISAPVLLIHSKNDDVVPFAHQQLYYDALTTPHKEKIVLENSLHVITEDMERETVFKAAGEFVAKWAGAE